MAAQNSSDHLLQILRDAVVGLVRGDQTDLTSRGLSLMLICYLDDGMQTVRGLAKDLDVAKPAITRTLDRLAEFNLIERKPDPRDGRSIIVAQTSAGKRFMKDVRRLLQKASKARVTGATKLPRAKA